VKAEAVEFSRFRFRRKKDHFHRFRFQLPFPLPHPWPIRLWYAWLFEMKHCIDTVNNCCLYTYCFDICLVQKNKRYETLLLTLRCAFQLSSMCCLNFSVCACLYQCKMYNCSRCYALSFESILTISNQLL